MIRYNIGMNHIKKRIPPRLCQSMTRRNARKYERKDSNMKLSRRFISAGTEMCELTKNVPAPYLRRTLTLSKEIEKAELSVCGLGFYRFWLNGTELTRGHMSPYISNPDDIMDYDVYDLTEHLSDGKNILGFQLGNGMQNAFGGYVWDFEQAAWRSAPKLAVCLAVTYQDGTKEEIEADGRFVCAPSPVQYDDIRQGEIYDANKEIPGWNLPDFDDSAWTPAISAETPRGKSVVCAARPIVRTEELTGTMLGKRTIHYAESDIVDEGYLYLFKENRAGICRLKIKGNPGQRVGMIFGEYISNDGRIYMDNIRFVRPEYYKLPLYIQKDEYICRGEGVETWEPAFTYHGFRYVLVTGITEEQASDDLLTYVVMNTELPERGGFSCSDETLNRLQRMVRVATLANFYHFPTDCPHREKNGWTADAALSTEHALLNLDPAPNYYEWMRHIRASMDERGAIPGIIPTGGWGFKWGNGPAWDKILVTLPYYVYRYRGDKAIVEESLGALLRYVNYLTTRRDERGLIAIGLGDWCAPNGVRSPLEFTDSVISMDICEKTAFLFEQCGKPEQAAFCHTVADEFRDAVRKHLIDWNTMTAVGTGTPTPGSQTSQAMAIFYNVFTEEEKPTAFRVLLAKIHENNDHLDTGVLGARVIFHVLTAFGESDLAYKIIVDPTAPSYGNFVARGETSLPESFGEEREYAPGRLSVDSRNHHFFGDVSGWFIKGICGINYNPTAADLHEIVIAPHFLTALTHAEGFHITPFGKVSVSWARNEDGTVTLKVEVPEELNGTIIFDRGWTCAECGKTEITAKSCTVVLKK